MEFALFADDLAILIDVYERHDWIVKAVNKRLREEFTKLQVQVNEEKTQQIDLRYDESFGFLGFKFQRVRSLKGVWRPHYTPLLSKRTELLRKLKVEFHNLRSQSTEEVIEVINPILRGWVNYFAWGNSNRCFYYIRNWVEKKVRRHLMRSRQCEGFGWKRWSSQWIYKELGLFNDYHVRRPKPSLAKAIPAR